MTSTLATSQIVEKLPTELAQTQTALNISNLGRSFLTRKGAVLEALSEISLRVRRSEVVAVLGPSGCGKSSLLRILAGLDEDYTGEIDWNLEQIDSSAAQRLRSATVFQSDSTFPWMNVEKNLLIGLSGLRVEAQEASRRAARYLGLVGLSGFRGAFPHELSGGMRQRVAIARALATEPLLLLMDEPLAALDAQTRLVMQQELLGIWSETRSTVIYITHDIGEALALADRIVVMTARPGRIKAIQTVPFGRDRDVVELRREPEFGSLEADLWKLVADEVGQSLDGSGRKEPKE
ncbi:MAG: transporter ATP-binding protein [Rhodospirillales bacterium]|nr:transporter ATP-binding protein [Rhodospirillales bacterium]